MRILYVTKVQLDRPYGGARHVLAVCRELVALGHRVTLIGPGREEPIEGLARIRPPARLKAGIRLEAVMASMVALELARNRPDVAYLRISATGSLIPLAILALRVPLILELNGPLLDELRAAGRSEAAVRAVQLALKPIVRSARAMIAPSVPIAAHGERALGGTNVIVVRNGADLDLAKPGDRDQARARLGVPGGRWIAFAGTLVPEQRMDLLCAAHARLAGVGLLVAGGGPRSAEVEAWAKKAPPETPVRFFGAVPHEQAIDIIRAADVCVSTRDGDLGMKPFEYAACGKRFVLFAEEGIDRLLAIYAAKDAVFPVREKTAGALEAALRRALEIEAREGPLPAELVDRVRAQVGWNRTAEEIAAILQSVPILRGR
jgi:D-inositol-3-phosphate glycosyltransferase